MSPPVPIKPRKLSHIVEERLLELIQNGKRAPGEFLPSERELMELYQVGRPAIREAMQSLQRKGLVEIRHGERPKVATPEVGYIAEQLNVSMQHVLTHSASTLEHLKEARATIEAQLARIAARRRTDADIARLRQILDAQKQCRTDQHKFPTYDGDFHRAVAAISGNPIFEVMTVSVFGWLREFHADLVRKPGLEELTLQEHEAILSAILDGDETAAGDAMQFHLMRANDLYRQEHIFEQKA